MKKLLGIIVLGLLLSGNAYAKIDKSYVKQIYEGCISDAKQNNDYNSDSKKFCKCYANEFNKRFDNEQLIKFLSKSDQAKAQIIQNEISPPCYPTTNKVKQNKNEIEINCLLETRLNINTGETNLVGVSRMFIIDEKNQILYDNGMDLSAGLSWSIWRWNEKEIDVSSRTGDNNKTWWEDTKLRLDRTTGIMVQESHYHDGDKFRYFFKCKLAEAAKF